MIATCRTPDCANAGHGVDLTGLTTDPDTGEDLGPVAVLCGVCGQPITDLT